jgi:hypothetical protein
MNELRPILHDWLRWFRFRRAIAWSAYGFAAGAGAGLAFAAYALLSVRVLREEYTLAIVWLALAGVAAGFMLGMIWRVDELRAARFFDGILGLKERVSTALELHAPAGGAAPRGSAPPPAALIQSQLADTVHAMRAVAVRERLPIQMPRRPLMIAVILLALSAGGAYAADAIFKQAGQKRATEAAIAAQAARVEALIEEITLNPDLTEEQKEALLEPLEQAAAALEQAGTLEEAVAALEQAQEELRTLEEPEAQELADNIQRAVNETAQDSQGPLEPFMEHLAEGDFQQAAEDLREINAEDMEQAELNRLADQLEALADALESIDPELAEDLRDAADAVREGDTQAAQQPLQQAAQTLEELGQQAAQGEAAEGAGDQLEEGQQVLVPGSEPGVSTLPQGNQGEGEGETGGNSGSGDGEGENSSGQGSEAGTEEIDQGGGDGLGESQFEPITPEDLELDPDDWVSIPPSGAAGDRNIGEGPGGLGGADSSSVPYSSVYAQYQAAAVEAIDQGLIPPQYRDLIREYFSSLEP